MTLPAFEYCAPRSVEEAIALCSRPGARLLAGGTDLLPQLRLRRRKAPLLVDLKRIEGLDRIRELEDGSVSIGATVSLAAIASHPAVKDRFPLLAECCLAVGGVPLRNRATMVGNICNASPAADTAVALLALDARVIARSPRGTRTIPLEEFFLGPGATSLAEGELVTEVILCAASSGLRGTYLRLSRRQGMDLATVGVLVGRLANGTSFSHRIALASVAPTPLRVRAAEAVLDAGGDAERARSRAAEIAREAARPITDIRGTAEYRREMVGVLTARGLAALK